MPAIQWLPWGADAFARARSEAKPVLLSIAPNWCRFSDNMDRTSYADPSVAAVVTSSFVPVRVDADRRPDVSQRYALGGWPTTAFLTPDGAILGGGTFVGVDRLLDVLRRVADAFASGRHLSSNAARRAAVAPAAETSIEQLVAQVQDSFDGAHGGFGGSPKFPHTAPVRLAIDLHKESGSAAALDMAVRSLDAMGWGPLYDERDGGFFRYSRDADWGSPSEEKLLDVNASMLGLYLTAFAELDIGRYGERADDILRYVQTWLADPVDGGWGASQRADPDYYRSRADTGETLTAPAVDRTLFADWNATMVSSALMAGRILGDPALSEFAIRSLERVVLACYRPGAGVAHYFDPAAPTGIRGTRAGTPQTEVRGLLADQIAVAAGCLDAFEATGNITYEMLAEELALYARRTMWDAGAGGFLDRAAGDDDIGLLVDRHKPFVANCAAARVLQRLARATRSKQQDFAGDAARTLAAIAPQAAAEGPLAAEFVLAVRECGQW